MNQPGLHEAMSQNKLEREEGGRDSEAFLFLMLLGSPAGGCF